MGESDFPLGRTLEQMGLKSFEEDDGSDILTPPPDQWQLRLWERSQAEIRDEKEKLIADMGAGRIEKEQFASDLNALNHRAAQIYQRLLAEERNRQSGESAE